MEWVCELPVLYNSAFLPIYDSICSLNISIFIVRKLLHVRTLEE